MSNGLELPVYKSRSYDYVRIKDVTDPYIKLEFERFMFGQTVPLLWTEEEGDITDAVFVSDYENFLRYLRGEYAHFEIID